MYLDRSLHAASEAAGRALVDLAVIIPTYNEAANVERMIASLDRALQGVAFEIIFVDDWSSDGTSARIAECAAGRSDVRVLRRWNRRGLSSAVLEGMMATMAPVVAVIDGDGQHDEQALPRLFEMVHQGGADVAIGSRYCAGGSTGEWDNRRLQVSQFATRLSRFLLPAPVSDPMSGFFAIRRELVEQALPHLSGRGFKILLDLLVASPVPLRISELPFEFRCRDAGESKLGLGTGIDYGIMLIDQAVRRFIPSRLALFGLVGCIGLLVHLLTLSTLLSLNLPFRTAQTSAVAVAIAFNFVLNNHLTFRDRRLSGGKFLLGLAAFYVVCGLGAVANIGLGATLFNSHHQWWLSGLAGALVGSLWNFSAAALGIWRRPLRT
jgi:dolichol-phosphate mannosyltransferase